MEGVQGVAEVAAVGVPRPGGGPERLVLHVVLKAGARGDVANPKTLLRACQAAVRTRLNTLFRVERVRPHECHKASFLVPPESSNTPGGQYGTAVLIKRRGGQQLVWNAGAKLHVC